MRFAALERIYLHISVFCSVLVMNLQSFIYLAPGVMFIKLTLVCFFFFFVVLSTILSLPKCGKGKPALVRRNTVDDKSELIACIETGNFAKAARIAAGEFAALCI